MTRTLLGIATVAVLICLFFSKFSEPTHAQTPCPTNLQNVDSGVDPTRSRFAWQIGEQVVINMIETQYTPAIDKFSNDEVDAIKRTAKAWEDALPCSGVKFTYIYQKTAISEYNFYSPRIDFYKGELPGGLYANAVNADGYTNQTHLTRYEATINHDISNIIAFEKTSAHEIGHTFGLEHCIGNGACGSVMDNGSGLGGYNDPNPGQLQPTYCDINSTNGAIDAGNYSCPTPSPTPTQTPGYVAGFPGMACPLPEYNFTQGPCGFGFTSDSTGLYCCRTGCPIQDCTEMADECETNGGIWKGCCRGCFSPIVIDIAGNGFNLTDGANGVDLDLTGEGTKDRIAWTAPNSDDAWLVLDRNGNGTVDSALELFGNFSPQDQAIPVKDRNGFYALAEFDKTANGGDASGRINRRDRVYQDLRLWQDFNHNGISEPPELKTMDELDVRAIDLDFKETKRKDQFGNRFKYRARVRDERDANVGRFAWDVFPVRPR